MSDFTELVDLAAERLGGAVLAANDEFFAPKENLLKAAPPVFREGEYTDRGKWMDGWETRRRRAPGHDWCLIRLGLPGIIRGVVVDTMHFKGNHPEQCSIEACDAPAVPDAEQLSVPPTEWTEILARSSLQGDSRSLFSIAAARRFTYLRFNIFPDGGVARLRVYGEPVPDWSRLERAGGDVDLAAVAHGGLVVGCSDMFFGHRHNLIMPGRALNMGDGWETRRRRGPGNDWVIVRLGAWGTIRRVEIDMDHFKGNAPESCSLDACAAPPPGATVEELADASRPWTTLLPRVKLEPDARHAFEQEVRAVGPVTHVRLNIFPDGGVARLRLFGTRAPAR